MSKQRSLAISLIAAGMSLMASLSVGFLLDLILPYFLSSTAALIVFIFVYIKMLKYLMKKETR